MSKVANQTKFCYDLMDRLHESVFRHEAVRLLRKEPTHKFSSGSSGLAEAGGTKTQIQADIMRLRRELSNLYRLFEEKET